MLVLLLLVLLGAGRALAAEHPPASDRPADSPCITWQHQESCYCGAQVCASVYSARRLCAVSLTKHRTFLTRLTNGVPCLDPGRLGRFECHSVCSRALHRLEMVPKWHCKDGQGILLCRVHDTTVHA